MSKSIELVSLIQWILHSCDAKIIVQMTVAIVQKSIINMALGVILMFSTF